MGFFDDLANKVGISSKSMGINTAATKAKRDAAAKVAAKAKADAEYQAQQQQLEDQYEAMKAENAGAADQDLVKQAMQGMGKQVQQQAIKGIPQVQTSGVEPSAWDKIRHGTTAAYQGALTKIGSPAGMQGLSAAAGLGAGLIGMNMNKQGTQAATGAYDQALQQIKDRQDISGEAFNAVKEDPEQLAMRQQALKGLSDRASMGLTPEDEAALQGINRQSAQQFKANNATIGQDMARRGMANSGLGLAQSMGAADQALQNQAQAGQQQAAMSFQAKQGALSNLANQAGGALQSDYARQMGKAQNLSAVNQFNAQQKAQANQAAASNIVGKGNIQQQSQANKAQGVQNIAQGVLGAFNPNKQK